MRRFVLARLLQSVIVVLLVAVLTFLLMHLLPGDPAVVMAGQDASAEQVDRIRRQLGLDRPLAEQLATWLMRQATGDFGRSLVLNQSVLSAVSERLPVTLSLTAVSLAVTLPVGIGLGALAAQFRNSVIDGAVMAVALLGVSVPGFWLGTLAIALFAVKLGLLPSSGYVPLSGGVGPWLTALIMPATVLAMFQIGFLARITRSAMLDVIDQDFIRTARAKGLGWWKTVAKHTFRNALIPVVTVTGIILSLLIGGAVVTEQVFALPGVGRLVVQAILARDYPLVQGTLLLLAFVFVLINLVVDIVYRWVDPRVHYGRPE